MEHTNKYTHETLSNYLIKDLVAANYKAAGIFEKYGIDFCCNGKRLVSIAIEERGIDKSELFNELESVLNTDKEISNNFDKMNLKDLANYIVDTHHEYIRAITPQIKTHLKKISEVHGKNHPYLKDILNSFEQLVEELTSHMQKEERILFPIIKYLHEVARVNEKPKTGGYGTITNPINMMEREHDGAGDLLKKINDLSNNFTIPEDACTTFQITYKELREFEEDLHIHIHLENNILFPKSIELENKLTNK